MDTSCAPLDVDLFLFCCEKGVMLSLSDSEQVDLIETFNSTSRYQDDLLNIPYFVANGRSDIQLSFSRIRQNSSTETHIDCLSYRYHCILKTFSKFYYIHQVQFGKYNIDLKALLQQGILMPVLYGDLFCKFKIIVRKPNFSDHSKT